MRALCGSRTFRCSLSQRTGSVALMTGSRTGALVENRPIMDDVASLCSLTLYCCAILTNESGTLGVIGSPFELNLNSFEYFCSCDIPVIHLFLFFVSIAGGIKRTCAIYSHVLLAYYNRCPATLYTSPFYLRVSRYPATSVWYYIFP